MQCVCLKNKIKEKNKSISSQQFLLSFFLLLIIIIKVILTIIPKIKTKKSYFKISKLLKRKKRETQNCGGEESESRVWRGMTWTQTHDKSWTEIYVVTFATWQHPMTCTAPSGPPDSGPTPVLERSPCVRWAPPRRVALLVIIAKHRG